MKLHTVDVLSSKEIEVFRRDYYLPNVPVVLKDLASDWPAYTRWDWDYFDKLLGKVEVGIYHNTRNDPRTPVNKADDYVSFSEYIEMIRNGPSEWRIFLFNFFRHAPELFDDFVWPEHLMNGFIKQFPMLFAGGKGAVTHLHFDMDLSHIIHTQFWGRKRVLLFPYHEQRRLYRKPFEVMTLVDFSGYSEWKAKDWYKTFPALSLAQGREVILERGDTLFIPSGFWHHMEYLESGFAMSLRSFHPSFTVKAKGLLNLLGMRNVDTLLKLTAPVWWDKIKVQRCRKLAAGEVNRSQKC